MSKKTAKKNKRKHVLQSLIADQRADLRHDRWQTQSRNATNKTSRHRDALGRTAAQVETDRRRDA